jgi:membrane protease YdiL (CAAX protease family)
MKPAAILLLTSLFTGLMLIVGLSWIYSFAAFFARKPLPLSQEPHFEAPANRGLIDILLNIVFYGLASLGALEILRALGFIPIANDAVSGPSKILPIQFYAAGAAQLVAIMLGTAFICIRARLSPGGFGWDLTYWRNDLILALYSFGVIIVPVFVIQGLLAQIIDYEHPAITPFKQNKSWEFFTAATFAVVLIGPIAEEFFFRGVLQAWFQRISVLGAKSLGELLAPKSVPSIGFDVVLSPEDANSVLPLPDPQNPYAFDSNDPIKITMPVSPAESLLRETSTPQWPIWVTSAIFALLHSGQGAAPAPLFVFSVMLGYLYRKTDRLLPVIAMHMFLNGLSMAGLALSTLVEPK